MISSHRTASKAISAMRGTALALAALSMAGCSSLPSADDMLPSWLAPHRIDVQQGNVVTSEQLARVKPGMSRLQVRDILGSPLLTDAFHPDRWDYIFTLRQQGKPLQRRNVVLSFNGDILKDVEAPDLPTEREFIDSISRTGRIVAAADLELTPEQLKNLPVPPRAVAPSPLPSSGIPNPIPPNRTFPPLEPS